VTSAVDAGGYEPTPLADPDDTDTSAELVEEQLQALGYV
jgi:hypothetical protein